MVTWNSVMMRSGRGRIRGRSSGGGGLLVNGMFRRDDDDRCRRLPRFGFRRQRRRQRRQGRRSRLSQSGIGTIVVVATPGLSLFCAPPWRRGRQRRRCTSSPSILSSRRPNLSQSQNGGGVSAQSRATARLPLISLYLNHLSFVYHIRNMCESLPSHKTMKKDRALFWCFFPSYPKNATSSTLCVT